MCILSKDPYVIPHTDILKNKFNITNDDDFNQMEAEYTSMRLRELEEKPLQGCFDTNHFLAVHKYIFQDIFTWAGKPRTIDIEKSEPILSGLSIEYAAYTDIPSDITAVLYTLHKTKWLDLNIEERAIHFASCMGDLWKIHPFREGNTRTVAHFLGMYADAIHMPFDRSLLESNAQYFRNALVAISAKFSDKALGNRSKPEYLVHMIKDAMIRGSKKQSKNIELGNRYPNPAHYDIDR